MLKPFAILGLAWIVIAAPTVGAPATQARHHALHHHLGLRVKKATYRHINYRLGDLSPAAFTVRRDSAGRALTPRVRKEQAPPRLTLDRGLGRGAVASVGLQRRTGDRAIDLKYVNGALATAPGPSNTVGAKVSYPF